MWRHSFRLNCAFPFCDNYLFKNCHNVWSNPSLYTFNSIWPETQPISCAIGQTCEMDQIAMRHSKLIGPGANCRLQLLYLWCWERTDLPLLDCCISPSSAMTLALSQRVVPVDVIVVFKCQKHTSPFKKEMKIEN